MRSEILKLLSNLEREHGIEILHACESGSRAWGFASPDSDYDIRFVYRAPLTASYGVSVARDSIELEIENDLDPSGWDLQKSTRLLARSNGALIEWLHSPIVYRANEEFLAEARALVAEHFSRRALANHYAGMARKTWLGKLDDDSPSGKSYLYALRSYLCAWHVIQEGTIPSVEFQDLLRWVDETLREEIGKLLRWKEQATESATPGRNRALDDFLREGIDTIADRVKELPDSSAPEQLFVDLLHRWTRWPVLPNRKRVAKEAFTMERVRNHDLLLFEAVSGSRSFGTDHAGSDTDLRGVFVAPLSFVAGMESIEQISDAKSDEVYYEVGRFITLLTVNNPNLIELLFTPESCVRRRHPAFDLISPEVFLSKLCRQSFGNYAMGQVRKARGLNKKIVNPEPEERKHLREFCHILEGQGTVSLNHWLRVRGIRERDCQLVAVRHAPGTYAIFTGAGGRGIFSPKDDSAILCSSVPKGAEPVGWMTCNFDAFRAHCRAHREYWQWVGERNEDRYATNISHGRGYDSKNLMHTLRLLDQALEIAVEGRISLPRPNADWLKRVRAGYYEYEDLLRIADERHQEMEEAFESSTLQERPSQKAANDILLEVRSRFS